MNSISPTETESRGGNEILSGVVQVLEQGIQLLERIDDETYGRALAISLNASIGVHYRHCLDHFICLTRTDEASEVDYDARDRNARIEGERGYALALTRELIVQFSRRSAQELDLPVSVRCKVNYASESGQTVRSNLGRELMYAIAHTVHHYALIAIMGRSMGLMLPPEFGVSPSTIQHEASQPSPAVTVGSV